MPIQHKHSPIHGNRANLTPGEIGHNRAEDVLLIRGNNQKLEIKLSDWRTRGVPLDGEIGAPLTHVGGALTYDGGLLSAGQVDGGFYTDEPPGLHAWGVPGFVQAQADFEADPNADALLPLRDVVANDVLIEDFYVASDKINVSHLGCRTVYNGADPAPPIRIGLADANGVILTERRFPNAPALVSAYVGPLTLTRGRYSLILWSGGPLSIVQVTGQRLNLSFDLDVDGHTLIAARGRSASADMSAGLYLDNGLVIGSVMGFAVGEDRHLFMRWALVTPSLNPPDLAVTTTPVSLSKNLGEGGLAVTDPVTAIVTGGSGAFLYSWAATGLSISAPDALTTTFSRSLGNDDTYDTTATFTVTDTVTGFTAQANVPVHMHADAPAPPGGGGNGGGPTLNIVVSPFEQSETIQGAGTVQFTVSVAVDDASGSGDYGYNWSVGGGRIVSDQNQPFIVVEVSVGAGESITGHASCGVQDHVTGRGGTAPGWFTLTSNP